jgi:diguanylate cyclase
MENSQEKVVKSHRNIAKLTHQILVDQGSRDQLTGLCNRRLFVNELERAQAMFMRGGLNYRFLYLDLDNFKQINDSDPDHHVMGDKVLGKVGETIKEMFRSSDVVGRLGGDEFGVLLLGYDPKQDENKLVTKFRTKFESVFRDSAKDLIKESRSVANLSISFGVVEPIENDTTATLLRRADVLMYKNKNSFKTGKNNE